MAGDTRLSSFTGVEIRLADHLDGVAALVQSLATRLGLPAELAADLALAARWHDAGKADPRFQRWLHGGSEYKALTQREPLAKSREAVLSRQALRASRERAGYPAGCRHELLSVALMDNGDAAVRGGAHDWELVLHLVGSHHGYCRPLAPVLIDDQPVPVRFERDGSSVTRSSAHDLARIDSGVADRFWTLIERYGWWGLAWLEAILRLSDHRQSAIEQDTTVSRHA